MPVSREVERLIVEQRSAAGPALADVRRRELREMTDSEAVDAVIALLDLVRYLPAKSGGSGFVDQQRHFARARP